MCGGSLTTMTRFHPRDLASRSPKAASSPELELAESISTARLRHAGPHQHRRPPVEVGRQNLARHVLRTGEHEHAREPIPMQRRRLHHAVAGVATQYERGIGP